MRPIDAATAMTVRWPVLKTGRPANDARFPEDDDPATLHLGAYDGDALVGVATWFLDPCPEHEGVPAWRLRGMAALAAHRGRGVGRLLLERGLEAGRDRGASIAWCNGRVSAAGFYEKAGFVIEGEPFELPWTGPHRRFVRRLP